MGWPAGRAITTRLVYVDHAGHAARCYYYYYATARLAVYTPRRVAICLSSVWREIYRPSLAVLAVLAGGAVRRHAAS